MPEQFPFAPPPAPRHRPSWLIWAIAVAVLLLIVLALIAVDPASQG